MKTDEKALVTGVAGFIGSTLAERLLESCSVVGIDCFTDYYPQRFKEDNLASLMSNERFRFIEGDLLDIELEDLDVDYIFHEAAQPGVRHSWGKDFHIYVKNNILATQKILEASINSNVKKILFASSSSVYGDTPHLPMHEEALPRPVSPYGVTKLAAENLMHLYWKNYDLPTISLRYFTVYGPRQRPDMAIRRFLKSFFTKDHVIIYGDGNQTRDFTYISDVVDANMLAAESHIDGETINIGTGSAVSVNNLLDTIEKISGRTTKRRYIKSEKGDMRHSRADIQRAKRLLSYRPTVSLEEGLKKTLEWMNKELKSFETNAKSSWDYIQT